ncbi:MAG TPA: hypothetical protein VEA61_15730 [Allosphingosinicella sp.]|nr:hypothetical protein [Allosphingosinicella sp.]
MKSIGSLLLSVLIGIVAVWLAVKLLGAALKLVGLLIGLALAVGAYVVLRGMIEGPRDA